MTTPPLDPDFQAAKKAAKKRQLQQLRASRERRQAARELRKQASPVQAAALERQKGKRQRQREARQYAEAWWQALKAWETHKGIELTPRTYIGSGGEPRMRVVGVGDYGRGQATLTFMVLETPLGPVSERAVMRLIRQIGNDHLTRVRQEGGMSSLLRTDGRFTTGGLDAAFAVLELAGQLGDERAAACLSTLH